MKYSILLLVVGFLLTFLFPLSSAPLTALVYFAPFLGCVVYQKIFPPYVATLSVEDKQIINTEKWESVIRTIYQIVGSLVVLSAFGINIPYIDVLKEALSYILGQFDSVVSAIQLLIGFGLSIYGFFRNEERFQARLTTGKRLK